MHNNDHSNSPVIRIEDLESIVGRRFIYSKSGSRSGWQGTVLEVTPRSRVKVHYDNGTLEEYSRTAFVFAELATKGGTANKSQSYLIVEDNSVNSPVMHNRVHPITESSFVIINLQTGKIIGSETTPEEADQFAQEQATDSEKKHSFAVFQATSVFAIERPRAKKRSLFDTIMTKLKS